MGAHRPAGEPADGPDDPGAARPGGHLIALVVGLDEWTKAEIPGRVIHRLYLSRAAVAVPDLPGPVPLDRPDQHAGDDGGVPVPPGHAHQRRPRAV